MTGKKTDRPVSSRIWQAGVVMLGHKKSMNALQIPTVLRKAVGPASPLRRFAEMDEDAECNRKMFMRAMQLEERGLYKQKRRQTSLRKGDSQIQLPQSEVFAEQVSALSIQDDDSTIPTPFYDLMTQHWESRETSGPETLRISMTGTISMSTTGRNSTENTPTIPTASTKPPRGSSYYRSMPRTSWIGLCTAGWRRGTSGTLRSL